MKISFLFSGNIFLELVNFFDIPNLDFGLLEKVYQFVIQDCVINETTEKANKTKVERGLMVDYDNWDTYMEYRKLVLCETRKHKKELFEKWNGFDFYDNEYIKENLDVRDKSYPSIDHKISIYYGYVNGISEKIIGHIDNLCICSRSSNSSKGVK
jgi:hypothetical protein